jgi:hypothetical protein
MVTFLYIIYEKIGFLIRLFSHADTECFGTVYE